MEYSSRLDFDADPKQVYIMLTSKEFWQQLAHKVGAPGPEVVIAGQNMEAKMTLETPERAQKFVGSHLTMDLTMQWSDAAADGSRTAPITIKVPGLPVDVTGEASIAPGGKGTIVEYVGDMKVRIPLVGKRLEEEAVPVIGKAFDLQQDVGDTWLSGNSDSSQ